MKVEAVNIYKKFQDGLNFDTINNMLKLTNNEDIGEISKKTVLNIAKWALDGQSNTQIAENLELTEKQFQTLCAICPTLVFIMNHSREMAEVVLVGSAYQRAIGGQRIKELQVVKVNDFDNYGRKVGEHVETVEVWKELPPEPSLLKFLMEHKLSESFGANSTNEDKAVVETIHRLDDEQMKQVEEAIKGISK